MTFNKQDIITSVKNLDVFLRIPALNGAKPKFVNGKLFVVTGGFNMVFQLEHQNKKWAFRVWHAPMGDNKQRYLLISNYLQKTKLPYFVGFIYDKEGLIVNGQKVDTIRMEWIEASVLKDYIEKHLHNKAQLEKLADDFLKMIKSLHKNQISHGDLQHGNILIDDSGNIKLVDYDSICTPDIEGMKELVTGLKGYQHPSRFQSTKASLKADYFSELIIYLSILGLANKPELWNKYKVKDTEYLLFSDDDFKDIEKSAIYLDLKGLDPLINALLVVLKNYLETKSYLDLKAFYNCIPPIIYYFNLSANIIPVGGDIELIWKVENAKKIELHFDGNIIDITNETSYKHKPKQNTTYTLKAIADNNNYVEQKVKVEVVQKVEIVQFKANKYKLFKGEEVELSWEVNNATDIKLIDPNNQSYSIFSNTKKIYAPIEGSYRLTAKNQFFSDEKSLELKIYPKPEVVSFVAKPSIIQIGSTTEIEWEILNAHSAKLLFNGKQLDITLKNSFTDTPKQDTTYTLEILALDKQTVVTKNIKVEVVQKVEIVQFIANKYKLLEGEEVELSWVVNNATDIKLIDPNNQNYIVSSSDTIKISDPIEGSYWLIAKNQIFKHEKSLELEIYPKPKVVSFVAHPSRIGIGSKTKIEWQFQNAHSAKLLFNGKQLDITLKDSFTDTPKQDTIYTLEITALDEQTVVTKEVKVEVVPKAEIKSFNADTIHVLETMPITFHWEVKHADSIKIYSPEGQETEVTHLTTIILPAQKSGNFTLKVKNDFFANEKTIYVHVIGIPKVEVILPNIQDIQIPSLNINLEPLENKIFQSIEDEFQKLVSTPRKNTLGWLDFVRKLLKIFK